MLRRATRAFDRRAGVRGFSLPELLIVIGILTLLVAMVLPSLQLAHREARTTRCGVQNQQIGLALDNTYSEFGYYPIWDYAGSPRRFTWLDVLVQRRLLANAHVAYCPDDQRPDPLNAARGEHFEVRYPDREERTGINYSYGIGVPLSSGAWHWRAARGEDERPRRFENHERNPAQRVLAGDGNWSTIFNLSGDALFGHDWSYPTIYDNTLAYRHPRHSSNVLLQDGHVAKLEFRGSLPEPINTALTFVWYPGEPLHVGPEDVFNGNWYPYIPPVDVVTGEGGTFPRELVPGYYTHNNLWTVVFGQ